MNQPKVMIEFKSVIDNLKADVEDLRKQMERADRNDAPNQIEIELKLADKLTRLNAIDKLYKHLGGI